MRIVWLINVVLGISVAWGAHTRIQAEKTYVLTPFLDVVPEGTDWTPAEVVQLQEYLPNLLEARDMAKGYAHLGSTLNIDDVIQGIEGLSKSQYPLSQSQKEQIQGIIQNFYEEHQTMRRVQHELLEIEDQIRTSLDSFGSPNE